MNKHLDDRKGTMFQDKDTDSEDGKNRPGEETAVDQSSLNKDKAEARQAPKENPGSILKRERMAQGLSLDVVHEVTKIPLDALRAIEEGYTIRMLSPFYYKGFVKMYAGYLGIDVSQVIDDYKEEELPRHIDQEVEEIQTPQWITNFFTRKRKRQIVIAAGIILAIFLFLKIIGFVMALSTRVSAKKGADKAETASIKTAKDEAVQRTAVKRQAKNVIAADQKEIRQEPPKIDVPKVIPKVEPKVQPVPEPQRAAVIPDPVPDPVPVSDPVPVVAPAPVPVVQKEIVLTVRAKQNSWLRVRTDDIIVFQSTLRLGAVETWMADDEIEISGKNINQLEFELNGKMIGTLGRKDRNANKVTITKNGLSVKN